VIVHIDRRHGDQRDGTLPQPSLRVLLRGDQRVVVIPPVEPAVTAPDIGDDDPMMSILR